MRLFSAKEVKQKEPDIRESRFLAALIKKQTEDWNEIKKTIDPEKQRMEKEFLSFNRDIQNKKGLLLKEVSDLEEKREKALEPLDQKWYELAVKEQELKEQEALVKQKENENAKEREFLIDKSIFITEKTYELNERELKVKKQEDTLKAQQSILKPQLDELNQKWINFHLKEKQLLTKEAETNRILKLESSLIELSLKLADKEKELDKREELAGLIELNVDYKAKRLKIGEKTIAKRDEWIKNKAQSLKDREKQIIQRQIEIKRQSK